METGLQEERHFYHIHSERSFVNVSPAGGVEILEDRELDKVFVLVIQ